MTNSFGAESTLAVGGKGHTIYKLSVLETLYPKVKNLPFSLKILLENLHRNENGLSVFPKDVESLAKWNAKAEPDTEIAFTPARVLLQDFTGVPCVVDLPRECFPVTYSRAITLCSTIRKERSP